MFRIIFASFVSIALAACGPSSTAPIEKVVETQTDAAFESPYFTVNVSGAGQDVILVPGLASSAAVWDATVAALETEYRLHVVQVSGFGRAAPRGNADNSDILDDLASDLARYSRSLDQPPSIVGHSLGGLVTLKVALNSDAVLSEIIIVDVLPFFSVLMDESASADSMAPVSAVMKASLLAQSDEVFAQSQAAALTALVKSETDRTQTLDWSIASNRGVMAQAMSEVLVTDLRAEMSSIQMPVTVIYAKDEAIPNMVRVEAFYADLYAPLPDGQIIAIDQALHFIMLDQPDAFHAALRATLVD